MNKISVVIPYYNESNTITETFDLVVNQSFDPNEVIFINSNSNDSSENILKKLISSYKGKIIFKNINTNSSTPSQAKNIGISNANNEIIAFMDCDMFFSKNWLKDQIYLLDKNPHINVIFGVSKLIGKSVFDKCCVIQTYGFNKLRPTIPSSLVRKKIFNNKNNLFLEFKALYDSYWIKNVIKSKKSIVNTQAIINYANIEYANNFKILIKKAIYYSTPSIYIYKTKTIIFISLSIILLIYSLKNFIFGIFITNLYFLLRIFLIPLYKSNFKNIYSHINYRLDILFMTGLLLDIGKLIGYGYGFLKYVFKRNNNIFYHYNR